MDVVSVFSRTVSGNCSGNPKAVCPNTEASLTQLPPRLVFRFKRSSGWFDGTVRNYATSDYRLYRTGHAGFEHKKRSGCGRLSNRQRHRVDQDWFCMYDSLVKKLNAHPEIRDAGETVNGSVEKDQNWAGKHQVSNNSPVPVEQTAIAYRSSWTQSDHVIWKGRI